MFQVEFSWPNGGGPTEACHQIASPDQKCPCAQGQSIQADSKANDSGNHPGSQSDTKCCFLEAVFLRALTKDLSNALTKEQSDSLKNYEIGNLVPAVVLNQYNMLVSAQLIEESQNRTFPTFVINGFSLEKYFPSGSYYGAVVDNPNYVARSGWPLGRYFYFQLFPPATSCSRNDSRAAGDALQVDRFPLTKEAKWVDNGIRSDQPKVYDVYSLRQMLATTASQLAGISGFNPATINSAVGNLQGVISDVSYLSAQATTVATPTVSSVASNGTTGNSTIANTSGQNSALSGSTSTIQCPAGTLPGIGTSGLPACVPLVTSSSYTTGASGNPVGLTGAGNNSGGNSTYGTSTNSFGNNSTNAATSVLGTSQNNSTTTTSGGQSGTASAVPVSNAFSAPNNVGVSSQDILAEQVQLNSQITTLQMALQGSLSDQYLVKEGKVVSTRQQTTLGFNINIDPPSAINMPWLK